MPKLVAPPEGLAWFKNRRGLYIEDGIGCLARVSDVELDESGIAAILRADSETQLICHFRENPNRFCDDAKPPFGDTWTIAKPWNWFFGDQQYWDGSSYGGFRLLFSTDVIGRFLQRDLSWMEDYF